MVVLDALAFGTGRSKYLGGRGNEGQGIFVVIFLGAFKGF